MLLPPTTQLLLLESFTVTRPPLPALFVDFWLIGRKTELCSSCFASDWEGICYSNAHLDSKNEFCCRNSGVKDARIAYSIYC